MKTQTLQYINIFVFCSLGSIES